MPRLLAALLLMPLPAMADEHIGIGYVVDRPLPLLAGVADAGFTENVGIGAEWTAFDNESALLQAMAAGEVQIVAGLSPEGFLDGINAGLDLFLVDVAAIHPDQWACYLRSDIAESEASLYGLKAALPYGSGAEALLILQVAALGADESSLVRRDLASADAAAALARGDSDIACGNAAAAARLAENGAELMDRAQSFALGFRGFSAVAATSELLAARPGAAAAFIAGQKDLSGDLAAIALASGMGEIEAEAALAAQPALPLAEKLGPDWFGGGLADYLAVLAELRAGRGLFAGDAGTIAARIRPDFLRSAP